MRRRSLWSVVAIARGLPGGLVCGRRRGTGANADRPGREVEGRADLPGPDATARGEAAGLGGVRARSRAGPNPGMYYWLRDGGSSKPGQAARRDLGHAALVGRDAGGGARRRAVPAYAVEGAKNEDWEDLTVDDAGALWIGQLGANNCKDQQRLLRVAEPDPGGSGPLERGRLVRPALPGQHEARAADTYNSEAMLWLDGHFYVFAKTSGTPVYRVDLPSGTSGQAKLTRIGKIGHDVDNISAASISDDRTRMMVQDHERLWVFTTDPPKTGDDFISNATSHKATGTAQLRGLRRRLGRGRLIRPEQPRHRVRGRGRQPLLRPPRNLRRTPVDPADPAAADLPADPDVAPAADLPAVPDVPADHASGAHRRPNLVRPLVRRPTNAPHGRGRTNLDESAALVRCPIAVGMDRLVSRGEGAGVFVAVDMLLHVRTCQSMYVREDTPARRPTTREPRRARDHLTREAVAAAVVDSAAAAIMCGPSGRAEVESMIMCGWSGCRTACRPDLAHTISGQAPEAPDAPHPIMTQATGTDPSE